MNKILSIYVIFIVCFYLPEVKLQNPSSFHSFGVSFGDTLLPKNDDGFFGPIKLGVGIPFFGNIYPNLFVNTNGVISFLFPINSSVPLLFPMLVPLIAVFWNDLNPLTSGQIYYRESFSTSDLTKAKEDVVKANVSFASYLPSRSFIITWDQVASYGSSTTNTFQAVISTDGKMSFLIFNFGLLGLISKNTQIGGNSGDGVNFYKFPETFTTNTASLAALSNINVPGKWVFKVDSFSSIANMPSKPSIFTF
jgi:alpha-tectorin